jgi:hypothetical protein
MPFAMTCPRCSNAIRANERNCPVCDADVGYPNVRAAQEPIEIQALAARLVDAERRCAARGCDEVLGRFRRRVADFSKAVLCRSLGQVLTLLSSDDQLYASFYAQVGAHMRRPEENLVEQDRLIADDLLFPYYRDQIGFAALSLNNVGIRHYGACSVTLSDVSIRHRATVFEKNSVAFCRERKLGAGTGLPNGYRATWPDRDKLTASKLHHQLQESDTDADFARALVRESADGLQTDFVEVHIFSPLHRRAVERVSVPTPARGAEEALVLEIERRADELGVQVIRTDAP